MIDWPKDWDPRKGWGEARKKLLTKDPRTLGRLQRDLLRLSGRTRSEHIESLGGPYKFQSRSLPDVEKEIWYFFEGRGKRPEVLTSKIWTNHDQWLRGQGSSLTKLCESLGLPGGVKRTRTVQEVRQEIEAYYKGHGNLPTKRTSKEWKAVNTWLERRGSSLSLVFTPKENDRG